MTTDQSDRGTETSPSNAPGPASTFWRRCHRYHELAERFARDVAITHPDGISGRHPGCPGDTECCGCCATGVDYYEHVPGSRHRESPFY